MKNLYFKRSNGEHLLIKENITEENALDEIAQFLKRHNYASYYTRYWYEGDKVIYDVGSWSEFLVLTPASAVVASGTEEDFIDKK